MEDDNYQKTVLLVDSIDATRGSESAVIDVSEIFANSFELKRLSYSDVNQLIERSEKGTAPRTEAVQAMPAQQPSLQPRLQVAKHDTTADAAGAAARLRSMAGSVGKEFASGVTAKVEEAEEANLVLPKLSVQDQLSDLEKMKEGIDEHVFGAEQLKIIGEEMKGMSRISANEDTSRMPADQRELVLMRNQRVKEIKGRLNIS
ncbi:MAG: hypothetical protein M1286_00835 [Candidatus Marsarchaeota archaeon]|nr:hypothetical protein [Candidatus Marsarchaeota archaeon]